MILVADGTNRPCQIHLVNPQMLNRTRRVPLQTRLLVSVFLTLMLMGTMQWLFSRVAAGHLFLWPCPGDAVASMSERQDAIATVQTWRLAAFLATTLFGILFYCGTLTPRPSSRRRIPWGALFFLLIATLLDGLSTLHFFHAQSIDLELHPGIRLSGYAFGRTTGPILGKGGQLAGLILIGQAIPAWKTQLYVTAAVLMLLAAAHNMHIVF